MRVETDIVNLQRTECLRIHLNYYKAECLSFHLDFHLDLYLDFHLDFHQKAQSLDLHHLDQSQNLDQSLDLNQN